jgi:indolepyruvate ferredoxin oxidoreductase beta subunit
MTTRTCNILLAALGGEGGGVLADWIVSAATLAGYPIQSTSVPGVAQRTGATTYYLEIFPHRLADDQGLLPVFALTPTPGDVDVVVASELVEAGRAIQNGFVTADRTTLIASTSRVYTIAERMAMADGRFDRDRLVSAARTVSHRALLFDMAEIAAAIGAPINSVLFGALIASGALPIERAHAEDAIRRAGKAVDGNLEGFSRGFEGAMQAASRADTADDGPRAAIPAGSSTELSAEAPESVREIVALGIARLTEYQGRWYADRYLERLGPILDLERKAGSKDFAVTGEAARYLALWMSYEDVIRVADLKTRPGRQQRVRSEVRARPGDIVRVVDFLKPGVEELCSVLPPALGRRLHDLARRRGWAGRLNVGMRIRSTNISGYLLLRTLASLRWWRPYTWRFQEETARIERWLQAIARAGARDLMLGLEIAACGQIVKGYGETHARATSNFDLIASRYFGEASEDPAALARAIRSAREAALSDPEGQALAKAIARSQADMANNNTGAHPAAPDGRDAALVNAPGTIEPRPISYRIEGEEAS